MRTQAILMSALLLSTLGAASCGVSGSVSLGAAKVDAKTLETQVTEKLKEQLPPDSVSCPDGLKAKVGATSTCTVLADDLRYTATITATKVKGTTVSFDLKMPPPATVPKSSLEKQVGTAVADRLPGGLKSVTCASDLVGTVGEAATCDLLSLSGETTAVTVTVTTATFTNVQFHISAN